MLSLGIETSCDETAVALYDTAAGLIDQRLYSQVTTHARYGGVVPELASRDHVRKLLPQLAELEQAHGPLGQRVGGVAYTRGPGLIGALLVGSSLANGLAWAWDVPLVGIHHMEGHILAPLLEPHRPDFPFLALLVSGGHTMLVDVTGVGRYRLLGETLDDAAGEAFDKTASLLGLPYPGGPALSRLAADGDPERFGFPRPMTRRPGLDFSFSGLKTHTRLLWENSERTGADRADIAAGFEQAVVETMAIKCRRALHQTRDKRLVVSGGVSANRRLRETLQRQAAEHGHRVYFPAPELCTDNAAMIAYAGALRLQAGQHGAPAVEARPRWTLEELEAV